MKETTFAESYPLYWPEGFIRTKDTKRLRALFKVTPGKALQELKKEIQRLGGTEIVISTNQPVRRDGLPYANSGKMDDPGVAVYFKYKSEQRVFACDKWDLVHHNVQSICKTIQAIRGMDRWGVSDMLNRIFLGFKQLPVTTASWWDILEVDSEASVDEIKEAYRKKAMQFHPDRNPEGAVEMARINNAYDSAQKQLNFS